MILDGNDITAVYYYDVSGSRISKSTEAGDTFFTYAGDILAAQKTGNNILVWIYDNNGAYIGFSYNGVEYYYVYNLQGDVEALADSNGTIIARYTYDPWGKHISITDGNGTNVSSNATHIANINPIRYRGYYYDTETGFYYLNSRYYDPEIGRFINADGLIDQSSVLGYNLFAYCHNNPVNMSDTTGQWPKWIGKAIAVVAVAAVVVAAVAVVVSTFGAGSVAGVAAISAAITIAARATEVAVLQVKKSKNSSQNTGGKTSGNTSNNSGNSSNGGGSNTQKSSGQVAVDVTESLFDNGLKIMGITPFAKAGSITFKHILNQQVSEMFDETTTLKATLSEPGGKFVSYAWAAYAWYKTTISIFSDDPVQTAEERGYTLK